MQAPLLRSCPDSKLPLLGEHALNAYGAAKRLAVAAVE
jgi:hypothetical protein